MQTETKWNSPEEMQDNPGIDAESDPARQQALMRDERAISFYID
jgi:hypothetical protein